MKKVLALAISLVVIFSFTACSKVSDEGSVDKGGDSTTASVTSTEKATTTTQPSTVKVAEEIRINSNEVVTIDGVCEFYIEEASIKDVIEPPYPNGYYKMYEADEGKTFVDIIFNYKNLSTVGVRGDKAISKANIFYNKDYKYNGYIAIEQNDRSDFAISGMAVQISPLTSEYVHFIFSIPQEVADDSGSLEVKFSPDNKTVYVYTVR